MCNQAKCDFLFLISLPETDEFQNESAFVKESVSQLRELGADVHEVIDAEVLSKISDYKYVIIIAHHDGKTDSFVLHDRILPIDDFIRLIPEDFCGILDLSSCYSSGAMARIKERTHNKCSVQTVVKQTSLALRLIMYPHIVQLLMNEGLEYDKAYSQVLDAITLGFIQVSGQGGSCTEVSSVSAVKLGETDNYSSIYAPSIVKRNHTFLVNVFFHEEGESGSVILLAQRLDPGSLNVDTQIIPIDLHRMDRLTARLSANCGNNKGININNGIDTKSIVWLGRTAKIQFPVTISDEYEEDTIVCELNFEVNSNPIGESLFVISVSETESQVPCSITLKQHDFIYENNMAKSRLQEQLTNNKTRLEDRIARAHDDEERELFNVQYNLCQRCMNLIDSTEIRGSNDSIRRVFISSTSDMERYRDTVKNEILSCGMYPVDYRTWYQSEYRPCDECCRKVMESDAYLCILGARYGYVDPSVGISMTQMEYETALMAGKKILAYIIDPLEESNEDEYSRNRQKSFINEIKSSRILKFFTDDYSLGKDTTRELLHL